MFKNSNWIGSFVLGLVFLGAGQASAEVDVQVTPPTPSGDGTLVELRLGLLTGHSATISVADTAILWVVDGKFGYVNIQPTVPATLIIWDGNYSSDIWLGGVDRQAGITYVIWANGGDDTVEVANLVGRPWPDYEVEGVEVSGLISGGSGNDVIYGGPGNEELHGDYDDGSEGADTIVGGDGRDVIFGEGKGDFLFGGDGPDIIYGGPGNDTLMGSEPIGHNGQEPIATLDGEYDELWGQEDQDNFIYLFYRWTGKGIFKSRKTIEFDLLMDSTSEDFLSLAEVSTVNITSLFR